MIELIDLSVNFGPVQAVDGVRVTIESAVTGVIGPNGAGKTTMLSAIAGSVRSSGEIFVNGVDVSGTSSFARARSGVRRTFQADQVVSQLNVLDNVRVGAATASRGQRRGHLEAIEEILQFVDPTLDPQRSGSSLTNLERRKVEIARALVGPIDVLLLDEPGAGLLANEKAELEVLIGRVPATFDAQVVLIEHDIDLVSRVCDYAVVLDFGRLIAEGSPDQVLASAAVRAAYLGESADNLDEEA